MLFPGGELLGNEGRDIFGVSRVVAGVPVRWVVGAVTTSCRQAAVCMHAAFATNQGRPLQMITTVVFINPPDPPQAFLKKKQAAQMSRVNVSSCVELLLAFACQAVLLVSY